MVTQQPTVVAVVDDDPGMRNAFERLLSSNGYLVELFSSADDFLLGAPTSNAKCVVIDIQLGTTTGVELGRQLVARGFTFPIIFMTGSDDSAFWAQAMKLGPVAYLHKPFPSRVLIAAIKKAIGGGQKDLA
jgi:FixJ family two-component response regulator